MRKIIAFIIISCVKILSHLFYRGKYNWLTPLPKTPWEKARLMVLMNHTSLYEPLFVQILPFSFLWHLAQHMNVPGADVTLDRPIVGAFWKFMIPGISSVTRRPDESWKNYLASINDDSIIVIAPEGRMKRPDGKDKFGKPMTIRGGIADIINNINEGDMILCFSGGLHHVQAPGQFFPRLFKTIHMNLAFINIAEYKKNFSDNPKERKVQIVQDLQRRLENDCPPD